MSEVYDTYWQLAYPDNWHLELLLKHPDHIRQGAATKLVRWGLEQAGKECADPRRESSPLGSPLYKSLGFYLTGRRVVKIDDDKVELNGIIIH